MASRRRVAVVGTGNDGQPGRLAARGAEVLAYDCFAPSTTAVPQAVRPGSSARVDHDGRYAPLVRHADTL